MNKQAVNKLKVQASDIRKKVLSIIVEAHASHIGSSYSIVEIMWYLYEHVLKINPKDPLNSKRDRFILAKGWGVSTLYVILSRKGFFPEKLLNNYCKDGSKFIGSATLNGLPGIEATTGSMGHGLPIGVGMALAGKLQGEHFRVFVIIGDGDLNEGSTWEAILQASHHKLDNLILIVDNNGWQSFGKIKEVLNLEPFVGKFNSFGWEVKEINGHSFQEIHKVFKKVPFKKNKPSVIIAHTIKGKGVSAFEDKNEWHYKTPTEKEIEIAKDEL
jgi:transketolase